MSVLTYQAYDKQGREVTGSIEAESRQSASETLRRRGLFVVSMHEKETLSAAVSRRTRRGMGRGKAIKALAVFTRQLCVLMGSGTQVVEAIGALERQTKPGPWRDTIGHLRKRIEEGDSLTEAMEHYPAFFDSVYCSLVSAGESSGQLPEMLDRLAVLKQKQLHVRNTIIGALTYPCLLILLALGMFSMMLIFIIPRFAALFANLDVPLPASTQVLVSLSTFYRHYWWAELIVLTLVTVPLISYLRSAAGRRMIDTVVLKLPGVGNIVKSFATARIVRLLGVLTSGHVPLLKALHLIENVSGNIHYRRLITRAQDMVSRGEPLSAAFADEALISPSVQEAIRSGERSGKIDELMLNVADFLEDDNEVIVRSLTTLIEPVILIVMGILVALVAVSMFLPLFDLTAMTQGG